MKRRIFINSAVKEPPLWCLLSNAEFSHSYCNCKTTNKQNILQTWGQVQQRRRLRSYNSCIKRAPRECYTTCKHRKLSHSPPPVLSTTVCSLQYKYKISWLFKKKSIEHFRITLQFPHQATSAERPSLTGYPFTHSGFTQKLGKANEHVSEELTSKIWPVSTNKHIYILKIDLESCGLWEEKHDNSFVRSRYRFEFHRDQRFFSLSSCGPLSLRR